MLKLKKPKFLNILLNCLVYHQHKKSIYPKRIESAIYTNRFNISTFSIEPNEIYFKISCNLACFLSFDLVHISFTGRSAIVYFEQFQTLAPLVYYFNWRVGNSVERDLPSLLLGHPIFFQTQTKHTISQNHIRNTQPHTVVLRETDSFANF